MAFITAKIRVHEAQTIGHLLRQILPELLDGQPVQLAYLYGSAVTGQIHSWSDIDVGLVFDPVVPLDDYQRFRLTITLEAELEQGIIDESFVMTTRQMASVRNRLVHPYWSVDNVRL